MIETTTESPWADLQASFSNDALIWRIQEVSEDKSQVRLRPQLRLEAVLERLNNLLGITGWSSQLFLDDGLVGCTLTIAGVSKSAATSIKSDIAVTKDEQAYDAFIYAAEGFGILPPSDVRANYWVDYDAELGGWLYEPEIVPVDGELALSQINITASNVTNDTNQEAQTTQSAPTLSSKPEGQQAIDRLVERLKDEGMGLEAAKLLIQHGGYGKNPDEARELYAKLRSLLLGQAAAK